MKKICKTIYVKCLTCYNYEIDVDNVLIIYVEFC